MESGWINIGNLWDLLGIMTSLVGYCGNNVNPTLEQRWIQRRCNVVSTCKITLVQRCRTTLVQRCHPYLTTLVQRWTNVGLLPGNAHKASQVGEHIQPVYTAGWLVGEAPEFF